MKQPSTKNKIKIVMLGSKTAEIKFSDPGQAKEFYEQLRNTGILAGEAIKSVELI